MAQVIGFTCDVCQEPKRPQDRWFLAQADDGRFTLTPWSPAERDERWKHICSPACAAKLMSQTLDTWQ